jgi:uracil-DNA glycosylase
MLVKAHPSPSDVESGNAFTDEAEALGKAFEALHVPLGWLYGSVAVRCGLDGATGAQTAACSSHLLVEIEAVQPRVLVAFGRPTVDALRSLDGRCGLTVPADVPAGEPVALRGDLVLLATEPMPDGVKVRDSKRRLWRDLQAVPSLLGPGRA